MGDDDGCAVADHLLGHRLHFDGFGDVLGADYLDVWQCLFHIVRSRSRSLIPAQVALRTNEDDAHLQLFAFAQRLCGGSKLAGGSEGTVGPSLVEDLDEFLGRAAAQEFYRGKGKVGNESGRNGSSGWRGRQRGGCGSGLGRAATGQEGSNQNNQQCRQDRWDGWES